MDCIDFFGLFANIATCVAAILAYKTFRKAKEDSKKALEREKKQATLEAFNLLQEQVLDKLNRYTAKNLEEIATDNTSEEYKKILTMLARCEHFAIGVKEEIYDRHTVQELSGVHLYYIYKNMKPIIEKNRGNHPNREKNFKEFEKLAQSMKEI